MKWPQMTKTSQMTNNGWRQSISYAAWSYLDDCYISFVFLVANQGRLRGNGSSGWLASDASHQLRMEGEGTRFCMDHCTVDWVFFKVATKIDTEVAEIVQLVKERQYTPKFSWSSIQRALLPMPYLMVVLHCGRPNVEKTDSACNLIIIWNVSGL